MNVFRLLASAALAAAAALSPIAVAAAEPVAGRVYVQQEGFVDANGVLIYYKKLGQGPPLILLHGGPGASHDYMLPYLLPLMRRNTLVFIDERGSGRSEKLADPKGYTVEAMADDVEAVRKALGLGKVNVLGHSCGGVLAQAYALKYGEHVERLVLCSTFHSTKALNAFFKVMRSRMPEDLRKRLDQMEAEGLFGHGKDYEKNRYTQDYMVAAWGEGYFPYLYQNHPDPNFDPAQNGIMSWDLYREMWGSHGEYVVDGNMVSVEYADRLKTLTMPVLVNCGDHDECDPSIAKAIHEAIPGSKLVIFPKSGHMTFVDQPDLFIRTVDGFLHPGRG